jgi:hypothetical protein
VRCALGQLSLSERKFAKWHAEPDGEKKKLLVLMRVSGWWLDLSTHSHVRSVVSLTMADVTSRPSFRYVSWNDNNVQLNKYLQVNKVIII